MTKQEMFNAINAVDNNKKWNVNPLHIAKEEAYGMNDVDMKKPKKFVIGMYSPTYSSYANKHGIYGMLKKVLGYEMDDDEISNPISTSTSAVQGTYTPNTGSGNGTPANPDAVTEPVIRVDEHGNVFKDGSLIHRSKSKFLEAKELWKKAEFEVDGQQTICWLADVSVIDSAKKSNRLCKFKDSWVIPHPIVENSFVSSEEFAHKEKSDDQMEHWLKREALNGNVVNMILISSKKPKKDVDDVLDDILS